MQIYTFREKWFGICRYLLKIIFIGMPEISVFFCEILVYFGLNFGLKLWSNFFCTYFWFWMRVVKVLLYLYVYVGRYVYNKVCHNFPQSLFMKIQGLEFYHPHIILTYRMMCIIIIILCFHKSWLSFTCLCTILHAIRILEFKRLFYFFSYLFFIFVILSIFENVLPCVVGRADLWK